MAVIRKQQLRKQLPIPWVALIFEEWPETERDHSFPGIKVFHQCPPLPETLHAISIAIGQRIGNVGNHSPCPCPVISGIQGSIDIIILDRYAGGPICDECNVDILS